MHVDDSNKTLNHTYIHVYNLSRTYTQMGSPTVKMPSNVVCKTTHNSKVPFDFSRCHLVDGILKFLYNKTTSSLETVKGSQWFWLECSYQHYRHTSYTYTNTYTHTHPSTLTSVASFQIVLYFMLLLLIFTVRMDKHFLRGRDCLRAPEELRCYGVHSIITSESANTYTV